VGVGAVFGASGVDVAATVGNSVFRTGNASFHQLSDGVVISRLRNDKFLDVKAVFRTPEFNPPAFLEGVHPSPASR
jgi:hypothetical protein